MWILALDSTGRQASVALAQDGRLVALVAPRDDAQHSVLIFRAAQEALKEAGISLADVDLYAAASGPGAFTALRVGLSIVKGLAEMHGKPVVPVSALEAVCESATAEGLLVPIVDAYRGQIFGGLYHKQGSDIEPKTKERVAEIADFLNAVHEAGVQPADCTLVGPQFGRWSSALAGTPFAASRQKATSPVLADAVARLAAAKFARGGAVDAVHLEANYIRRSDAELLWKNK